MKTITILLLIASLPAAAYNDPLCDSICQYARNRVEQPDNTAAELRRQREDAEARETERRLRDAYDNRGLAPVGSNLYRRNKNYR